MNNELITEKNNERVSDFFLSLEQVSAMLEKFFSGCKPTFDRETFYTDAELSKKLKMSRRSLQDYRNEGYIAYLKPAGKVLYKSSDIENWLAEGYSPFLNT